MTVDLNDMTDCDIACASLAYPFMSKGNKRGRAVFGFWAFQKCQKSKAISSPTSKKWKGSTHVRKQSNSAQGYGNGDFMDGRK
jgi:hypothetical protein